MALLVIKGKAMLWHYFRHLESSIHGCCHDDSRVTKLSYQREYAPVSVLIHVSSNISSHFTMLDSNKISVEPSRLLDLPKRLRLIVYEEITLTLHHRTFTLPASSFPNTDELQPPWATVTRKALPVASLSICKLIREEVNSIMAVKTQQLELEPLNILTDRDTFDAGVAEHSVKDSDWSFIKPIVEHCLQYLIYTMNIPRDKTGLLDNVEVMTSPNDRVTYSCEILDTWQTIYQVVL
jgi:hypothetical protein